MGSEASDLSALPVDLFVLAATSVYMVVGWIVGVRLLRLARRTRGLPELTLGLGECLLAGLVPPFFILAQLLAGSAVGVRLASFAGHLVYTVGCAVMIVFVWRVFRPRAAWAGALSWTMIAALCVGGGLGMSRAFLEADAASLADPHSTAFLAMEWISVVGFLWASAEAFALHGRLRRQAAIGLADPEVVNRVWLYGVIAVGGVVAAGVPVAVASMGIPAAEHVPTRIVCAVATLTSSVSAQLAFLPPPAYRRWLRSRASA